MLNIPLVHPLSDAFTSQVIKLWNLLKRSGSQYKLRLIACFFPVTHCKGRMGGCSKTITGFASAPINVSLTVGGLNTKREREKVAICLIFFLSSFFFFFFFRARAHGTDARTRAHKHKHTHTHTRTQSRDMIEGRREREINTEKEG